MSAKSNAAHHSGSRAGHKVGNTPVMVRAFEDEPVKLVAVSTIGRIVEVGPPNSAITIGFPRSYVYEYAPDLYNELRAAWDRKDAGVLASLWKTAHIANLVTEENS